MSKGRDMVRTMRYNTGGLNLIRSMKNNEAYARATKAQAEAWSVFKRTEAQARAVFDEAAARAWAQYQKEYQK